MFRRCAPSCFLQSAPSAGPSSTVSVTSDNMLSSSQQRPLIRTTVCRSIIGEPSPQGPARPPHRAAPQTPECPPMLSSTLTFAKLPAIPIPAGNNLPLIGAAAGGVVVLLLLFLLFRRKK